MKRASAQLFLDGQRIRDEDVEALAHWAPTAARTAEVPFVVGRVLLQDFTGVPFLVDLAAMLCQFADGVDARTLGLDGTERFNLALNGRPYPRQPATLQIERRDGRRESVPILLRIDTPIEAAYFSAGGILPYILEKLLARDAREEPAP